MSEDNKLIRMANQIATFFHSQPGEDGPQSVASHINKFWEPRMRRELLAIAETPASEALDEFVRQAMPLIRRPPPPAPGKVAG